MKYHRNRRLQGDHFLRATNVAPQLEVLEPRTMLSATHYYALTSQAGTWANAEAEAVSLGGHLASITSQAEQNFVVQSFLTGDQALVPLWMGLTDQQQEGVYQWTNGDAFQYNNWNPQEPNSLSNEDYGVINWHVAHGRTNSTPGDWNDAPNTGTSGGLSSSPENYRGIMEFTSPPIGFGGVVFTFEPPEFDDDSNDEISEAIWLGAVNTYQSSTGSIDNPTDVDLWGFTVTAGQKVAFDIDRPRGTLDSVLRLFDHLGNALPGGLNDDGAAPGESTSTSSYLEYTFTSAGTYYVGVSGYNSLSYDPVTGGGDVPGSTGEYQLILTSPDLDDQISEAKPLGVLTGTRVESAQIDSAIDVDMFGFTVSAGQRVTFDIDTATNGAPGLRSYLRLFDASGLQLAVNNDGRAPDEGQVGFDSYLEHTFQTAGTYNIAVSNWLNTTYHPITGDGDIAGASYTIGTYSLVLSTIRSITPGVTIITHGYQFDSGRIQNEFPAWTFYMADAIRARAGVGTILIHDLETGGVTLPPAIWKTDNTYDLNQEIIYIFNWKEESDKGYGLGGAWLEAAADALFASLFTTLMGDEFGELSGQRLFDRASKDSLLNFHFIGHSRGAVLNTLVTQRFDQYFQGMKIDHVTTLDPHPADGPADQSSLNFDDPWSNPNYTKLPTYTNVAFADNYYQQERGYELDGEFDGITVDGALNAKLDQAALDAHGYSWFGGGAHADVHLWYHGTIDTAATASDGEYFLTSGLRSDWYTDTDYTSRAYSSSRIGGGFGRPQQSLFGKTVAPAVGQSIFNGSFDYVPTPAVGTVGVYSEIPGWDFHGGGGDGKVTVDVFGHRYVTLDASGSSIKHNPLFIPPGVTTLQFDHSITNRDLFPVNGQYDRLEVLIGGEKIGEVLLSVTTSGFQSRSFSIPQRPAGIVAPIEFRIIPAGSNVDSVVHIDNVHFGPDSPARVSIIATDSTANETGGGTAAGRGIFTVSRTGGSTASPLTASPLTVSYRVSGTARIGEDYTSLSGSVTIPAGATSALIVVDPIEDAEAESAETVVVSLNSSSAYRVDTVRFAATVNILDNEPTVTVTAIDASAAETPLTNNPGKFRITRTGGPTTAPLTVNYTVAGTAASDGSDYAALSGSVVIPVAATFVDVIVAPVDDSVAESTESVLLILESSLSYRLGTAAQRIQTVTIADNEPTISITATDKAAAEATPANNPGKVRVSRTGGSLAQALVVSYTVSGTATSGDDYVALTDTAIIPAGKSFIDVVITPVDDDEREDSETIIVTLSDDPSYRHHTTQFAATVTLADNEPVITVRTTDSAATEKSAGTTAARGLFTISRKGGSTALPLDVTYTISGTATAGDDYALLSGIATIPAGKTSVIIEVQPFDDILTEPIETVVITLDDSSTYRLGKVTEQTATVKITDYELAPDAITGRTINASIRMGTPPFAGKGSYQLIASDSEARYVIVGGTGVDSSFGEFTYQKTTSTTALLTFMDSILGVGQGTLTFTKANVATFSFTDETGGAQSGTMTLLAIAATLAPPSIAGRIASAKITSGVSPFASKGTFQMSLGNTGLYSILGGTGVANSNGTFSYERFNATNGLLNFDDSLGGKGWGILTFTALNKANYVFVNEETLAMQRGTMTF